MLHLQVDADRTGDRGEAALRTMLLFTANEGTDAARKGSMLDRLLQRPSESDSDDEGVFLLTATRCCFDLNQVLMTKVCSSHSHEVAALNTLDVQVP